MTTTSTHAAPTEALRPGDRWPDEWWERWARRRRAWAARHRTWLRRLLVARLVLLAASALWLVVAGLLTVWVRESMVAVYVGSLWVCLLWFLVLRTTTVTTAGVLRWFAGSVVWSLVAGWCLFRLAHTGGLFPSNTGAMTMIAALGEESLKILPLAVLAVLAPGRARRLAVADWMLLALVSGAGFLCAEEVLKRFVLRERWGDALFVVGGPTTFDVSGITSSADYTTFFPGHHVLTGLVGCAVGLAAWWWRRAGRLDVAARTSARVAAVGLVVATWWSAVAVHAETNLLGQDVDLLPWPVRAWLVLVPDTWGGTATLVAAVLVVTAVDGHLLRGSGGLEHPVPVTAPLRRVDVALARVAAQAGGPVVLRRAAGVMLGVARAWWFVVADTVRTVTLFVASGARQPGERRWTAVRRAQGWVVAVRRSRELALHRASPPAGPGPTRVVAAAAVALLVVLAGPVARGLAQHVETTRDRSLGITWWMAGILDRLDSWWDGLSGWEKVAVVGAAFALTALTAGVLGSATIGGALMTGVSGASGAFTVVDNADHLAAYASDPSGAAERYWQDATPGSVLLDVGTLALTFWAPSRLAAPARHAIDDALHSRRAWAAMQPEPPRRFRNLAPEDPIRQLGFSPIDPGSLRHASASFNYVVTVEGKLVVANRRYFHPTVADGNDVLAAGEFKVLAGAIRWVNNASGHYQPHGLSARAAAERAFSDAGLPIPPDGYKEIVP